MRSSLACWSGLSVSPGKGQTACLYLSQRGERAVQKLGVWIKEYRSNNIPRQGESQEDGGQWRNGGGERGKEDASPESMSSLERL